MGLFDDLRRLVGAARQNHQHTDFAEQIRQSANLAKAMSAGPAGSGPTGSGPYAGAYGAASANPFDNMAFMNRAIPASGTIISVQPTGKTVGEVPVYLVLLEMHVDGHEPYQANYQTVIAAAALPNWQPGRVLPFRISPDDPEAIMLG